MLSGLSKILSMHQPYVDQTAITLLGRYKMDIQSDSMLPPTVSLCSSSGIWNMHCLELLIRAGTNALEIPGRTEPMG